MEYEQPLKFIYFVPKNTYLGLLARTNVSTVREDTSDLCQEIHVDREPRGTL